MLSAQLDVTVPDVELTKQCNPTTRTCLLRTRLANRDGLEVGGQGKGGDHH